MTEKMSLTKALLEIKLIDKKIHKKIHESRFVDFYQERQKDIGGLLSHLSTDKFTKEVPAIFQSIQSLFDRRKKIKTALSKKNAETMVKIGLEDYSIAEAIELKRSIEMQVAFATTMKQQYFDVQKRMEQHNSNTKAQVEKMVIANLGSEADPKSETYRSISDPFMEANKVKILDPLLIKGKFEKLEDDIDEFKNNVDCALSEINSKTEIEIDV